MKHSAAHPGFKAIAAKLAHVKGIRNPGAVLAAGARKASAAAKRANPRLERVSGVSKPSKVHDGHKGGHRSGDLIRRAMEGRSKGSKR